MKQGAEGRWRGEGAGQPAARPKCQCKFNGWQFICMPSDFSPTTELSTQPSPPPLSLSVCVCVPLCACKGYRLRPAGGLTKAKVPRCQVAVKLLLRARTQNRIEPNGMERNGTPNQIVIIRDGTSDIPILLWTKLSHRSTKRQATFNMRKILYPCRV